MRLYIDPGTGSMLFTILIGVLGAAVYAMRNLLVKVRFYLSAGKESRAAEDKADFAIFSDSKRYWNVFKPICDEFEKRGQSVVYMTSSPDDPALAKKYENVKCEFIGEGNKAFAKLNMYRADVLLSSTPGLDVYQWKRSKDVKFYAHIPHAVSDITIYRMFGIDYYDAILLSGEYQAEQVRKLEALRHLPAKELPIVGQPYTDAMLTRRQSAPPVPEHERTVLLAPSWGESAILRRFGGKIIDALLSTGYHIIIRPHPQSFTSEKELMESLMAAYPDSDRLEWNRDNDNFDVLDRSDIMISDFSGVIFDFALVFDRPVIYADTQFDKSPYDACWLDEEMWTFAALPKIGKQLTENNFEHIKELIDECLTETHYKEARDTARAETWAHIGEGAARTVDYLMEKHRTLE